MSAFDIFLIVAMCVALVWGGFSGFFRQIGSLAGLVLGIVACRMFAPRVASALGPESLSTTVMAYALVFIVVFFACKLVAYACRGVLRTLHVGFADRLCGAALRAVLWLFAISLALNVWEVVAPGTGPEGSTAAKVEAFAPWAVGQAQAQMDKHK